MKYLILGDVHNQIQKAEDWCIAFPDHFKIFIGDYFDSIGDGPSSAAATAKWLKESLMQPDRLHLLGNHDLPYWARGMFGATQIKCPGWSPEKNAKIQEILTKDDWNQLKFYHSIDNWRISHAGFLQEWWGHPLTGEWNQEYVDQKLQEAIAQIQAKDIPGCLWAADSVRGGMSEYGGLLWADWTRLTFWEGNNQIVGHSWGKDIRILNAPLNNLSMINIGIDCGLLEVLELDPLAEVPYKVYSNNS